MSTTPPPDLWNNILKDNVEKDDPIWNEYLDKAAVFDARKVDEWNSIVDVLLVYVALFISVLTSFIANAFPQFHRDPADTTNDLLIAIYNQLVAQSNNISIPPVDPSSYSNLSKAEYEAAFIQNALLYISLSLSIVVSVIALVVKLWLVSYSHRTFSVGSPYDRAMKRQEAYNGILVWNLEGMIDMLPVILLIALYLFGFYVYKSVWAVQGSLGYVTAALLSLGLMFVIFTSLGAAFVPGCPFRSPFSSAIRFIYEKLHILSRRIPACGCLSSKRRRWLWIGGLIILWLASDTAAYATSNTSPFFIILLVLAGLPVAYSAQQEAVHKPQKYKIPILAAFAFLSFALSMIIAICFEYPIFTPLYIIGVVGVISSCWMISKIAKSMADTGEIDAIAWLLVTTPPQDPATLFKKAAQMTGINSIGRHYRPRLLESLMPLLTPLITSYHAPEHDSSDTHSLQSDDDSKGRLRTRPGPVDDDKVSIDEEAHSKNLETYIACLARLSEFTDHEGTFCYLREDAMQHPKLEQPLIDKLVEMANPQRHSQVVRSAAIKVLNNYELNAEGNPLRGRTTSTVLEGVATIPRNAVSSMSNSEKQGTRVEQEEIDKDVKSEIGDEKFEA